MGTMTVLQKPRGDGKDGQSLTILLGSLLFCPPGPMMGEDMTTSSKVLCPCVSANPCLLASGWLWGTDPPVPSQADLVPPVRLGG